MRLRRRDSILTLAFAAFFAFAAPAFAQTRDFGVLVMAHGGGAAWNDEVEAMLAPVARDYPLEIAFGMADPATMQDAVRNLESRGARRIAVVRLFISGESWRERTEQILGLRAGAPQRPSGSAHAGHGGQHGGHSMELWRISTAARFALSQEGLVDAPKMTPKTSAGLREWTPARQRSVKQGLIGRCEWRRYGRTGRRSALHRKRASVRSCSKPRLMAGERS